MSNELQYIEPPHCSACCTNHEPEYPHVLTTAFHNHFLWKHGKRPTIKDTYSHCKGLIYQAAERVAF